MDGFYLMVLLVGISIITMCVALYVANWCTRREAAREQARRAAAQAVAAAEEARTMIREAAAVDRAREQAAQVAAAEDAAHTRVHEDATAIRETFGHNQEAVDLFLERWTTRFRQRADWEPELELRERRAMMTFLGNVISTDDTYALVKSACESVCEAAIEAGHKMDASHDKTDCFLAMPEDAFDAVSFEPLQHDQVAYVLDASTSTPILEPTLRRLYIGSRYNLNPFTNLPLRAVKPMVLRCAAWPEACPSDACI